MKINSMKFQRGISLNGLMIGGAILAMIVLGGAKITPDWVEYGSIKKIVKDVAADPSLKESSMAQIRAAYDKRAEIDTVKSLPGSELDITKEGTELVISFAYTRKVKLFGNVSLVFDFEGSSAAQ